MFKHIIVNDDYAPIKLCHIGTSKNINNNCFGPGTRDLYLIHYVVSGKGYFNGNLVKAGQGFLIKPHTFEHYFADIKDPWEYIWVTSKDTEMDKIFPMYNADFETQIFNFSPISALKSVIPTINHEHNKVYSAMKAVELFLRIFNSHSFSQMALNEEEYFKIATNYISSNIYKPIFVKEITDILGVSQPYLYKVFKNRCNMSPKEYINNLKISKAAELLKNTSLNISEIAYSVGYEDPLSFSKFFKNKTGFSPKNYRLK